VIRSGARHPGMRSRVRDVDASTGPVAFTHRCPHRGLPRPSGSRFWPPRSCPELSEFLETWMGDRVGRVALFGIPLQETWSYENSGEFAPTCYLQTDSRASREGAEPVVTCLR
jgi:hypothetical protein